MLQHKLWHFNYCLYGGSGKGKTFFFLKGAVLYTSRTERHPVLGHIYTAPHKSESNMLVL